MGCAEWPRGTSLAPALAPPPLLQTGVQLHSTQLRRSGGPAWPAGAPSSFIGRGTTPPTLSPVAASRLGSAWTGAGFAVPSQTTSMQTGPPALTSGCGWPGPSVLRPDQTRLTQVHTCGCTATGPQHVPPAMGLQPPAHHHPPDPRKGHVTRPWTRPGHSECTRASVFVIG